MNKNECSICFNYYTNPKIIDCLHTFCATCLDNYVKTAASNNQFRCPLCRKTIKLPAGGVSKFPVNFYIDEQQLPEDGSQCQQHNREEDGQEPVSVCPQHKKENDLFCKNCNRTLCYKCFITGHQGHTVQNVEDVESEINQQLEELKSISRERIAKNKKVIVDLDDQIQKLEIQCETDCDKVDAQITKIYQAVADAGEKLKTEIRKPLMEQRQTLGQVINKVHENNLEMEKVEGRLVKVKDGCLFLDKLQETNKFRQEIEKIDKDLFIPFFNSGLFLEREIDCSILTDLIGELQHNTQTMDHNKAVFPPMPKGAQGGVPIYYSDWNNTSVPDRLNMFLTRPHRPSGEYHDYVDRSGESSVSKRGAMEFLLHMAGAEYPSPPSYWKHSKRRLPSFKENFYASNELVSIKSSSSLYSCIVDLVNKTWRSDLVGHGRDAVNLAHKNIQVTKIERVENLYLYHRYYDRRKELFEEAVKNKSCCVNIDKIPGSKGLLLTTKLSGADLKHNDLYPEINEHYVFHGASKAVIDTIHEEGFDHRSGNEKRLFGQALYMFESSTKADQYSDRKVNRSGGEKKMLLCRILLGNAYLCSSRNPPKYKKPPCKDLRHLDPNCTKHHGFFDSILGDGPFLFREFAVYDGKMVYPEYVITYKRI